METTLQNGRTPEALFQEHLKTVYRLAYTFMGNIREAEEAASMSFEKLFSADDQPSGSTGERAWLIDAVTGVCFSMLGKRQGKIPAGDEADDTLKALVALPDKYKTAAYLFYCEGLTAREIAELVGDKPSNVSSSIDKVRRLLKTKLGGDFDD